MLAVIIASISMLIAGGDISHPGDAALTCSEIKQKIRYIRSRMRAGYTRAEGEKLEAQLRRYRALRKKAC
jgi:hypothetical protein